MTQPYYPAPGHVPYQVLPRYRQLRTFAVVAIALMGLTALLTALQSVLMWRSYDEVKNFIFLNLTEDEMEKVLNATAGGGALVNILGYLLVGTCIAYLLWLWYARENTVFLNSALAPRPPARPLTPGQEMHRRSSGWVVGGWFCPVVQFWYPLQIVQDIVAASEPLEQPGAAKSQRIRVLLYSWWVGWVGYWVIILTGLLTATVATVTFIVQVVNATENRERNLSVEFYRFQDVMVSVALWVDIGFTVAALLLAVSTVAMSLLMLQIGQWQQQRATLPPMAPVQDFRPPTFPSYRPMS